MKRVTRGYQTLIQRSSSRPFATNLSLVSIPIGILAIVIGSAISSGFTHVWGDHAVSIYVWGVTLLLGGYNVAAGLLGGKPARERAGLFVLATAYAFYGVCVIIGLGWGGMVTGPTFVALAISCLQRARDLKRTAGLVPYDRGD